jgi:hypothetical protein
MPLSKESAMIARDLKAESAHRPYVATLMPAVVEDDGFWRIIVEFLSKAQAGRRRLERRVEDPALGRCNCAAARGGATSTA